ncbi:CDP-alcohol phosphatidyltransferase family protein [Tepidibacter formicigenes]|jgi:CDP-diacylglycerol--glycerol-3-phosphate 3-phosphatidyltransferase|uniref:CDP-diacylglycerol--glycerol-3-phosphate 3-phosphatidyltransferase n=1 Tax=Tepidibacter formicigenes DSM 15518 TaxID=1123349 RepID=A0A1M6PZ14_9FIRM|nr:CDP-alcohol phosphatidyltransferase family protein [Tepidibacter formicigenes]SHK13235.1 CDP-diacylglycerol--glycerol-3-phosphate 3-phosphatidyltransferase [Tepidibacter formicigenes DSM 15518]
MLDTHARKYVNPIINLTSKTFLKCNMTPNQVTFLAFIIGISTSIFIYLNLPITACVFLWISGFLDAVDGAMARAKKNTTPWGTLMDITFDRIVEISVIISLAVRFEHLRFNFLILTSCILFSMTIFLTVGALSDKNGIKSFYYQAGIAERTEGFILLTLMILCTNYLGLITNIFSVIVLITAIQRMVEARKIFLKVK